MVTSNVGMLGKIDRCWARLLNGLALFACLLVALMVVVICADVATRALRWGNLPWAPEIAEYTLYLSTFLAAPWLLREGKHVRMDMMLRMLPPKTAWAIEFGADLIGASTCFYFAAASTSAVLASAAQDSLVLKIIVLPEWWVLAPAALMFFILAVEFLFRIRRLWLGPRRVREEATSAA